MTLLTMIMSFNAKKRLLVPSVVLLHIVRSTTVLYCGVSLSLAPLPRALWLYHKPHSFLSSAPKLQRALTISNLASAGAAASMHRPPPSSCC
jgi:hypothetical protein